MRKKLIIASLSIALLLLSSVASYAQSSAELRQNTLRALGYIPIWAKVVYGVNPKTSFRELGASFYPDFFEFYELLGSVGIDLDEDLDGFYQGNERMTTNTDFVIVVLGNLRPEYVSTLVENHSQAGYSAGSYQGIDYYTNAFFPDLSETYHFSIAYINSEVVLLANDEISLQQSIDLVLGNTQRSQSVRGNNILMSYIDDVYESNLVWMCGFLPDHIKEMFQRNAQLQMFSFVQDVDAVQVTTNWDNVTLEVELSAVCLDEESAVTIERFVTAFLPNFLIFTGDDPVFSEILDTVDTSQEGLTASVNLEITRRQLLQLIMFIDLLEN